jgi:hypothetical protein
LTCPSMPSEPQETIVAEAAQAAYGTGKTHGIGPVRGKA